jgi:hypothetical protein
MDLPDGIEYWFGNGDGAVTTWRSPAFGHLVPLDFDGDGRVDDLILDLDGDGRADVVALDLDDDGVTERWFADDGTGTWSRSVTPRCGVGPAPSGAAAPPGTGEREPPVIVWTPPTDSGARQAFIDTDGDGTVDGIVFDSDGDGRADGGVSLVPRPDR